MKRMKEGRKRDKGGMEGKGRKKEMQFPYFHCLLPLPAIHQNRGKPSFSLVSVIMLLLQTSEVSFLVSSQGKAQEQQCNYHNLNFSTNSSLPLSPFWTTEFLNMSPLFSHDGKKIPLQSFLGSLASSKVMSQFSNLIQCHLKVIYKLPPCPPQFLVHGFL